jgi:putative hemolysin
MLFNIGLIIVLIFCHGIFSMSELAIVSARRARLEPKAAQGNKDAKAVIDLQKNPNLFLSTVQTGITLISTVASAFGGAKLADQLAVHLATISYTQEIAHPLAFGIIVVCITYASLVIGELVPKTLAIAHSEKIALLTARPMKLLYLMTFPVARFLSSSTYAVLKVFKISTLVDDSVTEDEILSVLDQGTASGVLKQSERELVEGVFDLDEKRVRHIMTPRNEIVFIDAALPLDENLKRIKLSDHSIFPLIDGASDIILGVISIKSVLAKLANKEEVLFKFLARPAVFIPDNLSTLRALGKLREAGAHAGLVLDEYGSLEGMITISDITDTILGSAHQSIEEPAITLRDDGSWLMDGKLPIEELKETTLIPALPDENRGDYETLAGFFLALHGKIPVAGDKVEWYGFHFEVVDMDGRRIDKLLVSRSKSTIDFE